MWWKDVLEGFVHSLTMDCMRSFKFKLQARTRNTTFQRSSSTRRSSSLSSVLVTLRALLD
jgi:hypothetical protein